MRLGELLIAEGIVAPVDVQGALADQRRYPMRLGSILHTRYRVDADAIARALARQHGVHAALLRHLEQRDPELARRISAELAHQLHALPVAITRSRGESDSEGLVVCMRDPADSRAVAKLAAAARRRIVPAVTCEVVLSRYLAATYRDEEGVDVDVDVEVDVADGEAHPVVDGYGSFALVDLNDQAVVKDFSQVAVSTKDQTSALHSATASARLAKQAQATATTSAATTSAAATPAPEAKPAAPTKPAPKESLAPSQTMRGRAPAPSGPDPTTAMLELMALDAEVLPEIATPAVARPRSKRKTRSKPVAEGAATLSGIVPPVAPTQTKTGFAPPTRPPPPPATRPPPPRPTKPPPAKEAAPPPSALPATAETPPPKAPPREPPKKIAPPALNPLGKSTSPSLPSITDPKKTAPRIANPPLASTPVAAPLVIQPSPARAEAATAVAPAATAVAPATPVLDLASAQKVLDEASTRDAVGDATIAFLRGVFEAGAVLSLKDGVAMGHRAFGGTITDETVETILLPMSTPSALRLAHDENRIFSGKPPETGAVQTRFLRLFGAPKEVVVAPVRLKERVVCLLFGSNPAHDVDAAVRDVSAIARAMEDAYARIIRDGKKPKPSP